MLNTFDYEITLFCIKEYIFNSVLYIYKTFVIIIQFMHIITYIVYFEKLTCAHAECIYTTYQHSCIINYFDTIY